MSSNQESQLQGLLLVQSRIAERGIVQAQVFFDQTFATADALRDSIARQLEMHASKERSMELVDLQRRRELRENAAEMASLDARGRAACITAELSSTLCSQ